ncbi:hypothetical protein BU16DRAFT_168231 [Lophium mytilinum]|uniref:Uncharacterized protein n=1 Tax=Lophium mytilinum TaxID=390894 RepID=A0A6A6QD88_9PEZI|nr:hypothetical protein BU16DRAFT_168231 [Lophium mytilinum]
MSVPWSADPWDPAYLLTSQYLDPSFSAPFDPASLHEPVPELSMTSYPSGSSEQSSASEFSGYSEASSAPSSTNSSPFLLEPFDPDPNPFSTDMFSIDTFSVDPSLDFSLFDLSLSRARPKEPPVSTIHQTTKPTKRLDLSDRPLKCPVSSCVSSDCLHRRYYYCRLTLIGIPRNRIRKERRPRASRFDPLQKRPYLRALL